VDRYQGDIDQEIEFYGAKPFSIDMWYNRNDKSWVVQLKDKENNQLGDSTYVHSKPEAIHHVNWLKEKYNVPLIRT